MKNSAAEMRFNVQVRKEREHAKTLSGKTLLFIDQNPTSLHFSTTSASLLKVLT